MEHMRGEGSVLGPHLLHELRQVAEKESMRGAHHHNGTNRLDPFDGIEYRGSQRSRDSTNSCASANVADRRGGGM